jgi:hypothetical protein
LAESYTTKVGEVCAGIRKTDRAVSARVVFAQLVDVGIDKMEGNRKCLGEKLTQPILRALKPME